MSKPLENIVAGMGIEGIGPQNAKALVEHAGSLENLMNMTEDELKVIDGIGVLASNISEFMLREGFEWLELWEELGLNTVAEQCRTQRSKMYSAEAASGSAVTK